MKYLVMECHDAYAVLMDENARCVHAANLHYTVGQTVTDPVLMQDDVPQSNHQIRRKILMRCAAAAACLLIAGGAGFGYYLRNLKTRSTIMMSSDLKIMIELNSRGNVVCIKSDQPDVQAMLDQYDARYKSKLDVVRDLIELEKEQGILTEGDTVDLYLTTDDHSNYSAYKSELEQDNSAQDVTINVQPIEQLSDEKEPPAPPAPPEPAGKNDPPAPKDPPHPAEDAHPAPPEPKEPPKDDPAGKHEPKDPPADGPAKPEPKDPPHPHDPAADPAPPAPPAPADPEADKQGPAPHEHPEAGADDKPEKPTPPVPRPEPLPEAQPEVHPLP